MRRKRPEYEYTPPGEEFSRPPEQPETLNDRRRYPGAEGFAADSRAPADPQTVPTLETAAAKESPNAGAAASPEERKAKRRRTLLLQASAVAATVVLATNSFGIDFLGFDGLFNDSVILGEFHDHEHEHWDEPYED
jgi:hypothetical protein